MAKRTLQELTKESREMEERFKMCIRDSPYIRTFKYSIAASSGPVMEHPFSLA